MRTSDSNQSYAVFQVLQLREHIAREGVSEAMLICCQVNDPLLSLWLLLMIICKCQEASRIITFWRKASIET